MLHVAISLVGQHNLSIPSDLGVPGRNGHSYSMWYPLLSFLAVPFVYLGRFLARLFRLPELYVIQFCAVLLSTIISAATAVVTTLLAMRLGATVRRAIAAGVIYAFCTIAVAYARNFYADPLLAFFVTLGLFFALDNNENWGVAVCCLFAILAKPTGALLTVAVIAYFLVLHKKGILRVVVAAAIGGALFLFWDYLCFGSPFKVGQPDYWTLSHAPIAFAGLLISPGVGLFIYCPVLLLAFRRTEGTQHSQNLILGITLMFICLHSCWGRWYASDWGPRFLLPIIPALCACAILTRRHKMLAALAVLGFIIQIPTLFTAPERYTELSIDRGISQMDLTWNPAEAKIIGAWSSGLSQIETAAKTDVRPMKTHRPTARQFDKARFFKIVLLWWWMLPVVGVSRWWGILVSCCLVFGGIYLIRSSLRMEFAARTVQPN